MGISFLAKNREQAKKVAKKKGLYVSSYKSGVGLGLHDNQKNTPTGLKRWVSIPRHKR